MNLSSPCKIGATGTRRWYERTYGKLPKDVYVLHGCNEPSCRNLDHIYLGSQSENMKQMVNEGRAGWQKKGRRKKWKDHHSKSISYKCLILWLVGLLVLGVEWALLSLIMKAMF